MEWQPKKVDPVKERDTRLEPSLADIESHMPDGHPYMDRRHVTWAHETTHGLNARIRNQSVQIEQIHSGSVPLTLPIPEIQDTSVVSGRYNACYVLNNMAFVMEEPPLKLSQIANSVPTSMRGMSYRLYLIQQQQYWNDCPLYVLDEWSAYTNGLSTALDANGGDGTFSDVLQSLEFMAYTFVLARLLIPRAAQYTEFYLFIKWQAERCASLYQRAKRIENLASSSLVEYEKKILAASDFDQERAMLARLYGNGWLFTLFYPKPEPGPDPEPEPDPNPGPAPGPVPDLEW